MFSQSQEFFFLRLHMLHFHTVDSTSSDRTSQKFLVGFSDNPCSFAILIETGTKSPKKKNNRVVAHKARYFRSSSPHPEHRFVSIQSLYEKRPPNLSLIHENQYVHLPQNKSQFASIKSIYSTWTIFISSFLSLIFFRNQKAFLHLLHFCCIFLAQQLLLLCKMGLMVSGKSSRSISLLGIATVAICKSLLRLD